MDAPSPSPRPVRAAAWLILLALAYRVGVLASPIPRWPPPVSCSDAVMRNGRLSCPDAPARVSELCPGASGDRRILVAGDRVTCTYGLVWVDRMSPADIDALALPVDVNTAALAELQTLDGVGPKTAARIVEGRPYPTFDALLGVPGIGPKTLAGLSPRAVVRRPSQ